MTDVTTAPGEIAESSEITVDCEAPNDFTTSMYACPTWPVDALKSDIDNHDCAALHESCIIACVNNCREEACSPERVNKIYMTDGHDIVMYCARDTSTNRLVWQEEGRESTDTLLAGLPAAFFCIILILIFGFLVTWCLWGICRMPTDHKLRAHDMAKHSSQAHSAPRRGSTRSSPRPRQRNIDRALLLDDVLPETRQDAGMPSVQPENQVEMRQYETDTSEQVHSSARGLLSSTATESTPM